jgi:hypothetical protein
MPEPLRAAELDGLPDRRQAERLPRVDRDVEVLPLHVLEGVQMTARRPARLRARDVEAHHAQVPVADGQLGDLQRPCRGPHAREQPADDDPGPRAAEAEPRQHRLDHLIEAQSPFDMQLGSEPDLGVDDAVRGQVLSAFGGDPDQRLRCLHDRDRVLERLQIQLKMATPGGAGHRLGQHVRIGARQTVVADGLGQLHDGLGAQAAIQVIVQQDLRHGADLLNAQAHAPILNDSGQRRSTGVSRPSDGTWLAGTQTWGPAHR